MDVLELPVEVRRSRRRRRTVSAYLDRGTVIVLIPSWFSPDDEPRHVEDMVAKLSAVRKSRTRRGGSDAALSRRAEALSNSYLAGHAKPLSVRWASDQTRRWGSCTPGTAAIRLSARLQAMPSHVIDYVLLHELAHLIEPAHNDRFWALVARFPRAERARGFLEGIEAAAGLSTLPGQSRLDRGEG